MRPQAPESCIDNSPEPTTDIPPTATQPDCTTPSGCLFCEHQRDIDSLDHVWSLASFRHLKSFELAALQSQVTKNDLLKHPAEFAIERLTDKLAHIKASSSKREAWVQEALLRIEEGRYHPDWASMINDG